MLRRGDGPGRLTVAWTQDDYSNSSPPFTCERTRTFVVSPAKPKPPQFGTRILADGGLVFLDRSCTNLAVAAPGPITLSMSGDGKTRRMRLRDQCDQQWRPGQASAGSWGLLQIGPRIYFDIRPGRLGEGTHPFKYIVRFKKRIIEAGGIATTIQYGPAP